MPPKVLVVGAGTIGLRTAQELLRRGLNVVLRAPRHPLDPRTCSMGAAGLWMPVHSPDPRTNGWALDTLNELWKRAEDPENNMVEKMSVVALKREHSGPTLDFLENAENNKTIADKVPGWASDPRLEFQHLTVEMLAWQNIAFQLRIPTETEMKDAGYWYAWLFRAPVVDAPKMLDHMLKEVKEQADVDVETGVVYDSVEMMRQECADLGCDVVVNCTGLGAADLCNDKELVGGRGIVLLFDRNATSRRPEVLMSPFGAHTNDAVVITDEEPWATESMPSYLIPRGNRLVVGGSMMKGDSATEIRAEERNQLLIKAQQLGIDIGASSPIDEWIGFRPYRTTVRLEVDNTFDDTGVKVVHNYGHGGSGWTINAGCAKECADLVVSVAG